MFKSKGLSLNERSNIHLNVGQSFLSPGTKRLLFIVNISRWILLILGAFSVLTLNYKFMVDPPAVLPYPSVLIPFTIILFNILLTLLSLDIKSTSMAWVLIILELVNVAILLIFYGTQFALIVLLIPLMEVSLFASSITFIFIILIFIFIGTAGFREILISAEKIIIPADMDETARVTIIWTIRILMFRPLLDAIAAAILILKLFSDLITEEKKQEKEKTNRNQERQLFQQEIEDLNKKIDDVYRENEELSAQMQNIADEAKDGQDDLSQYKSLTKLLNIISSSKTTEEAIDRSIRNIETVIPCQTSCLFLVDEIDGEKELITKKVSSPFTERLEHLVIPWGHGIIGWVAKTGQSALLQNGTLNAPGSREVLHALLEYEPSALAVPVSCQNKLLGVMYISHPTPKLFYEEHEKILRIIATVLAGFLEEKEIDVTQLKKVKEQEIIFRQKEQTMENLIETLQNIIVVNQGMLDSLKLETTIEKVVNNIISIINCQSCLIFLQKKVEGETFLKITAASGPYADSFSNYKIKPTEDIIGYVYRKQKNIIISSGTYKPKEFDEPSEYKVLLRNEPSAMVAPLQIKEDTIGVIYVSLPGNDAYSIQDQNLLFIIAQYGAIAINNAMEHEKTTKSSITDELTGLENRNYFERRIMEELAICRRFEYGFALALIDIDAFKRFNDLYGKEIGDILLREIGGMLSSYCRETDCIARLEKDLFGVIFVHINKKSDAVVTSERLRTIIESTNFGSELGEAIQLTVSIGVSVYPDDGDGAEILFDQALITLEEAQKSGGNKTFFMG
ncbi:MAG TPA: diguanylate cyclase [Candidatus Eremiobacteraeota bacterium]|nr:diguanylate cyclase [Candidatus Eremiobacteraeota bacterium]